MSFRLSAISRQLPPTTLQGGAAREGELEAER